MKVIICSTPGGQYKIPLQLVAEHRARYYSEVDSFEVNSDGWNDEVNLIMEDDFEGIDWLLNNTNWSDWKSVAVKVNNKVMVTDEDFWYDSNGFEIIDGGDE